MLTKESILKTINELPDHFSIDELFDRIILLHKLELGIEQDNLGKTNTTQEAREKLKKWLE